MTNSIDEKGPAFPDKHGKPTNNVTRLAQESSEQALARLVHLTRSSNDCISFAAARAVLELGRVGIAAGAGPEADPVEPIHLTLKQFKEVKDDDGVRHHELPMVHGGWQGPRDLSAACGPRLSKVRREWVRAGGEPEDGGGSPPDLPGTGAAGGDRRGKPAATAKRHAAPAKTGPAKGGPAGPRAPER